MSLHSVHRKRRHYLWWTAAALLVVLAASSAGFVATSQTGSSASDQVVTRPVRLISTTPAEGAANVEANGPIEVRFNQPLSKTSPMPSLSPDIAGSWVRSGESALVFQPSADFVPGTTVTLTVPGGQAGVRSQAKTVMAAPASVSWTVQAGSTLRLQQLLGLLGYLPLSWTPASPAPPGPVSVDIQPGSFAWRWPNTPPQLQALWSEGQPGGVTRGAVMAFESVYNLKTDGSPGPAVWTSLLQAVAAGQTAPHAYSYVMVNQSLPETLQVWQNGSTVVTSPTNTGIAASPTPDGTWPVYARYETTTMSGTNPDGSYYSDPGVPWVSYFNGGDAIHGFIRGGYGSPQSLGCVELPYDAAQQVFPLTPIGTLVTVF